jgi:iron complex outermembrane receptor protein
MPVLVQERRAAARLGLAFVMLPLTAYADDPQPMMLPTVLIAPEWSEVDAQRTAKTVDTLSASYLDASGLHDTIALQYGSPGFIFKTNSVLGQPYLRGVGSDIISPGVESSVSTFIDGVYLPRAYDTIVDFFDVERVEVLKGPQGVHMGRNAVGGAISIHTRDPVPYHEGYVDVLGGMYDERRVRAAVNLPLAGPELSLRIAGAAAKRDGYVENVNLGTDVNDEDYRALRAKLRYAPSANLVLLFGAERFSEDSTRALGSHPDAHVGVSGGVQAGGIVPDDPWQITENVPPLIDVDSWRYSLRAQWSHDGLELRSTTAWLHTDVNLALDLDGTDADYAGNYPFGESETFSQEFRLFPGTPGGEPERWTLGVFFLDEQAFQALDTRLPMSERRNVPAGDVDTVALGAFGQYRLALGDDWTLRGGLRYSRDDRKLDLVRTVTSPDAVDVTRQRERRHWDAWTPELGLEYSSDPRRFWYGTVSRGYKAGGFNTSTIQDAFDPEFLWAYEVGLKSAWPERAMRVNLALFHYDYRDMQLNTPPGDAPPGTFPRVINAADATLRGAEAEVLWRPRYDLELSLRAMAMSARFDEFVSSDPNNPDVDPDRSGKRLPHAPRLALNAGVQYLYPLAGGMLRLSGEYRYQSSIYFNIYQDPALRQGGYGLFNAGLGWESGDERWYVEVYGRNLGDKLYAQTILRNDPLTGTKRFWGAPLHAGVRVGYRWW